MTDDYRIAWLEQNGGSVVAEFDQKMNCIGFAATASGMAGWMRGDNWRAAVDALIERMGGDF